VVVGSTTVKPGKTGLVNVSVVMHEGMDGPHLFHVFIKSSDPEKHVTVLKVKADIVPLETWRSSHPGAFFLPRNVANFSLGTETVGINAMEYADKTFGHRGQMRNAYLGEYTNRKKRTHLLISEYKDSENAKNLLSGVISRMEADPAVSKQTKRIEVRGNGVYVWKNEAHEFYYFQSRNKVVWLFPDASVARQTLEEIMKYIEIQGT
jgi:hypothetical protein